MIRLLINSDPSYSRVIGELPEVIYELYDKYKYVEVRVSTGKKRSLSQNAISHAWYAQIEKELKEQSASEVKCECKLNIGLAILRGDSEEFNRICEETIDPLPYEARLKAMLYFPVTSIMKVKQLSRYLEAMQKTFQGMVNLTFPEE